MDEKQERQWRRKAIRWHLRGLSPPQILQQIPRSRKWLYKWIQRFEQAGWPGLCSQSRQPSHSPHQYRAFVRRLVIQTRHRLVKSKVGLVGAKAIQRELKQARLLRRLPSASTIQRILRQAGLIKKAKPVIEPYFPQPQPMRHFVLHAMDWTARYLEGGAKVFAFHSLNLQTRTCKQTIRTDKSGPTVRTHVLEVWHSIGVPDGLQMDNDAAFCGGYKAVRVFGQLVRLCLYVGVEPIFLPVREPQRNGDVERLHGLWADAFWKRRTFGSVAHVKRASPAFENWYSCRYEPPTLNGQTPDQARRKTPPRRLTKRQIQAIPAALPITAGRLHFIRQVDAEGQISLLNETWSVGKRLADQYVWATIVTHEQILRIYHRRAEGAKGRQVKSYEFGLDEQVVALQALFKRPYRRPNVCTML